MTLTKKILIHIFIVEVDDSSPKWWTYYASYFRWNSDPYGSDPFDIKRYLWDPANWNSPPTNYKYTLNIADRCVFCVFSMLFAPNS